MIEKITNAILKTKATSVVKINIEQTSSLADYFVIATATSSVAVLAICNFLEMELKKQNIMPLRVDKCFGATWVVLDYGEVICHIFDAQTREYFNLEKLWGTNNNLTFIN